jgi:hypothetical protein
MSDADFLSRASDWRAYAEELFLRAKTMHDADVRSKLCEIAASYERLARRIEQREPGADKIIQLRRGRAARATCTGRQHIYAF